MWSWIKNRLLNILSWALFRQDDGRHFPTYGSRVTRSRRANLDVKLAFGLCDVRGDFVENLRIDNINHGRSADEVNMEDAEEAFEANEVNVDGAEEPSEIFDPDIMG